MAKYRIKSPDGQTYEVTAPDDASETDVLAYAQQNFSKQSAPDFSNVQSGVTTTGLFQPPTLEEVNAQNRRERANPEYQRRRAEADLAARQASFRDAPGVVRGLVGVGQRVAEMGRGLNQLYAMGADAVAPRKQGLASLISGQDNSRYSQAMRDEAAARESDRFMEGDTASAVGGVVGDIGLTFIPASRASMAPGLLGRLAGNAAAGAAYGGLKPVTEGESRGINAAIGGGLGAGGEIVGTGLRAVGRGLSNIVSPSARQAAQAASAEGIAVTPAQLGSLAGYRSLPLSGGEAANQAARTAWNRAAARSIGENADVVTKEVYDLAAKRQSKIYQDLVSRNTLKVDNQLMQDLTRISDEAASIVDDTAGKQVARVIDNFLSKANAGPDGVKISGDAFQALDTALGKSLKQDSAAKPFLADVRASIRRAMDDSISPEDAAAWRTVREEWGNRKTLTDLVAKAGGKELDPTKLLGRVNATKAGKERMARGRSGRIGRLADVGQMIPPMQPPERASFGLMTIPRLAVEPALGATLGRAANSSRLASLMLSPAPQYIGSGLESLSQTAAPGTLAASPFLMQLLQEPKR